MFNDTHMVIDLETVDTEVTAGILSIGAAIFKPENMVREIGSPYMFYQNVIIESCINKGMTFSWDTLMWWMKQSKEAGQLLQYDRILITRALNALSEFIKVYKVDHVWGNGRRFDLLILENAYKLCDIECSWNFRQDTDMRTIIKAANSFGKVDDYRDYANEMNPDAVPHYALDDAMLEAFRISKAIEKISCR